MMSGHPAVENPPASGRSQSWFTFAHRRFRETGALDRIVCIGLLIGAMALVGWVRLLPRALGGVEHQAEVLARETIASRVYAQLPADSPQRRAPTDQTVNAWIKDHPAEFQKLDDKIAGLINSEYRYTGEDGHQHVFLGDYDSYHWLRMARNYLHTGTTCDSIVDGVCRDTYTNAPVGRTNVYNRSLHIASIVALDRLITFFRPGFPIPSSSFLVQALIGMLGVIPAFAIGRRVAGNLGGFCAAIVLGLNPLFLERSLGSDDDVWNVVLPLFMVWALIEASAASSFRRQITYATIGAVFVGLHAASWSGWPFAYGALMIALLANLLFESIMLALQRARSEISSGVGVRRAAVVVAVFYFSAWITTSLAGASYLAAARGIVRPVTAVLMVHRGRVAAGARPSPPGESVWPHSFVAELAKSGPSQFARSMGGERVLLTGCLGLLLLALPQRRWRWWDFALLIGGAGLYRYGLTASLIRDWQLTALIAAPIAVAMLIDLMPNARPPQEDRSAALIVTVWFCTALYLGFSAERLIMLLAAPFAIAFGAIPGRAYLWLSGLIRERQPRYAGPLSAAIFVALAAFLVPPAKAGYREARNYLPPINQAWWATLEDLREQSPPNTIINANWDYGYWIKYAAERRVVADGGSLSTHIPYWQSRALLAPDDNQAVGLLRMLDCGSDATPHPEAQLGAYGKLIADGFDPVAAQSMVLVIAGLDFADAKARLARSGLSEAAQASVLASTHCDAPPAYLILSTGMTGSKWFKIGHWDFRRAYAYANDRSIPEAAAVNDLSARFGMQPEDARALLQQVRGLHSDEDAQRFLAPAQTVHHPGWMPCDGLSDGELVCTRTVALSQRPTITALDYRPTGTTLKIGSLSDHGDVQQRDGTPGIVLTVGDNEITEHPVDSPTDPDVAVMVYPAKSRALVGPSVLVRSTFTRLMMFNGRYSPLFTMVRKATAISGETVITWKINWPEIDRSSSGPTPKKTSTPSPGA